MSKRFVSWAAVSSLPQARKVSLDDQLRVNREHVDKHGGALVAELVVPGESRSIVLFEEACRRIEAYAQLHELIQRRAFDILIYLDRSRLGRTASLSMAVVELCREAGIIVYETESPPGSLEAADNAGYDDMLVGAIKSVGAQREVAKIQERHKMGMIGRIKRGEFAKSVPWGWKLRYSEDGARTVELDEDAARVIRTIFIDLYLAQGLGRRPIAEWLNARGLRSPTGLAWTEGILKTLTGRVWRYAGYAEINVKGSRPYVKAKGTFPAILTDEEAHAILAERKARAASRRTVAYPSYFSRIVICERHGTAMILNHGTDRTRAAPRARVRLRCRFCRAEGQPSTISARKIEAALRAAFCAIQEGDIRAALKAVASDDDSARIDAEIAHCQQAIAQSESALLRADDAYVRGVMDIDRYQRQVVRHKSEIEGFRTEIERLKTAQAIEADRAHRAERIDDCAARGLAMLDEPDKRKANAWLRHRVQVIVSASEVREVRYR